METLLKSKFFSVAIASCPWCDRKLNRRYYMPVDEVYSMDGEPAQLGIAVIVRFYHEAEQDGAQAYLLHLPTPDDIEDKMTGGKYRYEEIFQVLSQESTMIDSGEMLAKELQRAPTESLSRGSHYSPLANAIVAETISDYLAGNSQDTLLRKSKASLGQKPIVDVNR